MECLLLYLCMVTVPYIMVGVERMSDYRGVRLARFHCTTYLMKLSHCTYTVQTLLRNVIISIIKYKNIS